MVETLQSPHDCTYSQYYALVASTVAYSFEARVDKSHMYCHMLEYSGLQQCLNSVARQAAYVRRMLLLLPVGQHVQQCAFILGDIGVQFGNN